MHFQGFFLFYCKFKTEHHSQVLEEKKLSESIKI